MKVLSLNFLSCAVKACKSTSDSFPLHPKDAELAQDEVELNPQFIANVLPRLDWAALKTTSTEVCIYAILPLEDRSFMTFLFTFLSPDICPLSFMHVHRYVQT